MTIDLASDQILLTDNSLVISNLRLSSVQKKFTFLLDVWKTKS